MIENGFYIVETEFLNLIEQLGGTYNDKKNRPVFCCIEDRYIKGLYWAIPTSDLSHRSKEQIAKYKKFEKLRNTDIRHSYYHVGESNKKCVYRISSCFPIIDKFIAHKYEVKEEHFILQNPYEIKAIRKKLFRILQLENKIPNKFEQHITDIKEYLIKELHQENNCEYEEDWELE